MKIIIDFGFILIMLVIILMTIIAFSNMSESFSMGLICGITLCVGLIKLGTGMFYDTKKKKWENY